MKTKKGTVYSSECVMVVDMGNGEKKRRNITALLVLIALLVICVGIALIMIIAHSYFSSSKPKPDENDKAAKWAAEDSRRYQGIYVHGGDYDTFNALYRAVDEYFRCYESGKVEEMYDSYWASTVLDAYGYGYSLESYRKDMDKGAAIYHIYKEDSKHVDLLHSALTYQNYTNYYLYVFNIQYIYYDDDGNIETTSSMECTYTLFPCRDGSNNIYYRLLDFNINDIEMVSERFVRKGR